MQNFEANTNNKFKRNMERFRLLCHFLLEMLFYILHLSSSVYPVGRTEKKLYSNNREREREREEEREPEERALL